MGFLKFAGQGRIANFVRVQVVYVDPDSVFDLGLAQVVQCAVPRGKMAQYIGHRFRNQDMPPIAAIHDSLRDIDASACHIAIGIDVGNPIHRSGMDSHPDVNFIMSHERSG